LQITEGQNRACKRKVKSKRKKSKAGGSWNKRGALLPWLFKKRGKFQREKKGPKNQENGARKERKVRGPVRLKKNEN